MLVCLLVAVGCSNTHVRAGRPSPSTTASPPTPLIEDGAPCPRSPEDLGLSADTGCASSTTGSFEARQGIQELIVYAQVDARGMPVDWRVRVTRDSAPPLDEPFDFGSKSSYPLVLGAENADERGPEEAFVKVLTHSYHSGKTHEVAIFGVRGGHVFAVEADGAPLVFQVGGVSYFGEGAECRDVDMDGTPEFLVLRVDGVFGDVQTWSERIYEWKARSLTLEREKRGHLAKTGYHDPLLWRFYSLRCFSFDPPFPFTRG